MELNLTADQDFFRETTARFLEAEAPVASLRAREQDDVGFDRRWWERGAALGWTSMLVPEELNGGSLSGEGMLDLVLLAEEMGRVAAPGPLVPVNVVAETLSRSGRPDQQALLVGLVSGELIASWAINEPGGAWDAPSIGLQAVSSPHGFVLDGVKSLVEAGNQADTFLVTARADDGLTQFLVDVGTAGLTVTAEPSIDLGRRFATLTFSGAQVAPDAVVGDVGGAGPDVERQLMTAAVLQVAETCGVAAAAFDRTLEYMGDRYSFGRPLTSYQALKHRMADMKMWLEASFGLSTAAARSVQHNAHDASSVVSAAKAYIGEKATDLIQDCIQLHGGIGITWEHDLHLYLRRATVNRFAYGTPSDHRERLAALADL